MKELSGKEILMLFKEYEVKVKELENVIIKIKTVTF